MHAFEWVFRLDPCKSRQFSKHDLFSEAFQARRVGGGGGGSRGSNEPPKIFEVVIKQSKDCDRSITRTTTFLARIIGGSRNILAL